METFRSVIGYSRADDSVIGLTRQERIDFAIMIWGFGVIVGVYSLLKDLHDVEDLPICRRTSAFGTLVAEVYVSMCGTDDPSR
jgi:hypothetical protein